MRSNKKYEVLRIDESFDEEAILSAWYKFIKKGIIERSVLRPIVYKSWERSKNLGINPYLRKLSDGIPRPEIIEGDKINRDLFKISDPFLDILSLLLEKSYYAISIFDRFGRKINTRVSGELKEKFSEVGNVIGVNFSEECIGTNAVALALIHDNPVQLVGPENYIRIFHKVMITAIPIKSPYREKVGILSISCWDKLTDMNTLLGMAFASVRSIESSLQLKKEYEEKKYLLQLLESSLENMSDGLISIDDKGRILQMNSLAEKLLGIKREKDTGKNIFQFLSFDKNPLKSKKPDEFFATCPHNKNRFLLNVSPICEEEEKKGFVIIIREIKRLHKTISKIIGVRAHYEFKDIIGKSPQIKNVIEFGKIAASSNSNVLIYGENGTGKELLAHSIHNFRNKNRPFVPVNCAAIPSELIESELFGYEQGAFTGALKGGKIGKFELANGGTIFLDEISEMPQSVQAKILRIVEDRVVFRVGGTQGIPVDVRLIAATNKDLKKEVEKGNFRMDLFYRLNVLTIYIPPLRERREDIPLLVDHFINILNRSFNKNIKGVTKRFLDFLTSYEWPGNVRELRNFIERAFHFAKSEYLDIDDLPNDSIPQNFTVSNFHKSSISNLRKFEKDLIYETLKNFRNNKKKAAEFLGIGRATLYRKLKKFGES